MNKLIILMSGIGIVLATASGILQTSPENGETACSPKWNLTGSYVLEYTCTSGCSGVYPHTMNVNSMDLETGDFSGDGYYNSDSGYTWDVTGNVGGSDVTFTVDYTGLNPTYYVEVEGTIAEDGTLSGTATSSTGQTFDWASTSGAATIHVDRCAEITSPGDGEEVSGSVDFEAYLLDDDYDDVDWAVRKGTCDAATNTVLGNVDGHNDPFSWVYDEEAYTHSFSATADTCGWEAGDYCFIFNPREDEGEDDIRLTREFTVSDEGCIERYAEITLPPEDTTVKCTLDLEAFLVDDEEDDINWAVREGTCDAGTNTVLGNVDGHNDTLDMDYDDVSQTYTYTGSFDISGLDAEEYCFVFNPIEDTGEEDIRETRWFTIESCDEDGDDDGDGVPNSQDECPDTVADDPSEGLGTNRWIWNEGWITNEPDKKSDKKKAKGPKVSFTIEQTHGCSCFQILEMSGGEKEGHYKFGCSKGIIQSFISK
ncbi:MAG: hypothetical protein ACFFDI_14350 [Promethearchaeota archaeon]